MAMDVQRIRAVAVYYLSTKPLRSVEPREHPDVYIQQSTVVDGQQYAMEDVRADEHVSSLLHRLIEMIDAEPHRREKIMRWYANAQGALWRGGWFTINQIKEHSRPDAPIPEPLRFHILSDHEIYELRAAHIGIGFDVDTCEPQRTHLVRRRPLGRIDGVGDGAVDATPVCGADTLWASNDLRSTLIRRWRIVDCVKCINELPILLAEKSARDA